MSSPMTPLRARIEKIVSAHGFLLTYPTAISMVDQLERVITAPDKPTWCIHIDWYENAWRFKWGQDYLTLSIAEWDHCPVKGCHAQRPSDG